ncbi:MULTISPECIES: serpin family protein [Nocardioides]|uniref:Serpin family protein n=1 Tax=Nocardioides vastitatis TaxID=2568655 RepID=A0ABW0ZKY5_9ACTN|nr:serpin family protein [Nocardioides sp.]THI93024.1 serpin family protein [Nocardioides sp.]
MIDRRDTLRYGLLGLSAFGGAGLLTACARDQDPPPVGGPADPDGIRLVSSDLRRAAGDSTVLPGLVAGLRAFAGDLFGGLAEKQGNLVLSPYSVAVALGMTLPGAVGKTAEEMRAVLRVDAVGPDRWHKGVNALTAHVEGLAGKQERRDGSSAEIALATANQLFGHQGVPWEEEFLDLLAKEYGAGLRVVDFETATEEARILINTWVEQQTHDRIKDLIPQGVLDNLTRLVLVNAIYLKAPWEGPFTKELTAKAPFHLDDDRTVEVDMMNRPDLAGALLAGDGWRAARIPYAGQRMAMTVVLPDEGRLPATEAFLADGGLSALTGPGRPATIDLRLPRWTFRTQAPLGDLLKSLGMPTAFAEGVADFTAMTDDDLSLYIAAVLHQGFIAVDEEGTEAAAATAVVVKTESAVQAEELTVDRPFLFVIHDVEHGAPLFVGRVSDPTA